MVFDGASSTPTTDRRPSPRGVVARSVASLVLLTIAALALAPALVLSWARVQLVDEESFVATLGPLSSDPNVQNLVIDEATDAIAVRVDFAALASGGVDALSSLGLPPAAARVLGLLARPTADRLRSLTQDAVADVVRSAQFDDIWSNAVRGAHRSIVFGATSDGGGIIVQTPDGLGVQVGGIVAAIVQRMDAEKSIVAGMIPPIDEVVIVSDGTALGALRAGYAAATVAGVIAPIVVALLLVGGVIAAPRRGAAVAGAGGALVVGSALVLWGSVVATALARRSTDAAGLDPAGVDALLRQVFSGLMGSTGVVLATGVVMGIGAVVVVLVRRRAGAADAVPATPSPPRA
ncbi:hypothetical protein [Microbacterium trichothecenolyticum]|uniref:Integral membrane protein n=1 Tax=Microbacterium trichothecenolyticum TaxID=69370 RepID=A0ABU0TSP2_MICTR|nr:hypothetical protein [Microbacterium trichothecenolyticum]MDQ1122692.1 hypothetical protein [Microbacterium trichothecenolyticum]